MEKNLNVKLLYYTKDPERAVATAARLCYSAVGASQLIETMSDEQVKKILSIILAGGHSSTLEHASYTFAVEGVSRSLTHQLVRHRLASYNQQSQRYVQVKDGIDYIKPSSIAENPEANKAFEDAIKTAEEAYQKMIDAGVHKEDARYILPNATETKIIITMNIRELIHFFSVRCCNRAQWEIRNLAWQMLELVKPTAPIIFADCGPECVRTKCIEGDMSCKNPYPKVDRNSLNF